MQTLSRYALIGSLALLPFLGLAFIATPAHAVDIGTGLGDVGTGTGLSEADLPTVIGTLISIFLGILGIIFLILVLYAGFMWMTAAGNESKVETAKKLLTQAVIGLILILASYAIANFVVDAIATAGL